MKKTIWALFDDRVGSVNQAKGIIQALGNEYDVTYKHITYNRWASLPNCLLGASKAGISKALLTCLSPTLTSSYRSAAGQPRLPAI